VVARYHRHVELWTVHLPPVPYRDGVVLQERVRAARQAGAIPDTVLLLEHPPVYTRGRRTGEGELPMGEAWYAAQGIEVIDVNRGGKVTYHGPGQLVGYPIVGVEDVLAYVRLLERAMIAALGHHGITARARSDEGRDFTGVWVEDRKIGSIGVHVARGVTTHGFAVNVDADLQPFSWIVPCGLGDVRMTSIAAERGAAVDMRCFRRRMAAELARQLGARQRLVTPAALESALTAVRSSEGRPIPSMVDVR
jgi:lipoyl(octanoyl) transferase